MIESVRARLADRVARAPGEPAILAPGTEPTSAAALLAGIEATGAHLVGAGVGRDDTVAVALPNGAALAGVVLGTMGVAACAPLAADRPAAEHERDLVATGARLLVVQRGHDTPARAAAAAAGIPLIELEPGPGAADFVLTDPGGSPRVPRSRHGGAALVLFTSGTTSRPKLVPLTEANLLASADHVATTLALTPGDRCLGVMPLFHIHGLVAGLLAPLLSGGSVVCTPGFVASEVWDWIGALAPTWYTAVPTIHQAMLDVSRPLATATKPVPSSLTFARSSSAALPVKLLEELERVLGIPVIEAYGMTEAAHQIASNPRPPGLRRPGTVGRPAGCEVTVLDAAGAVLPPGTVGELAIRGPSVTSGYLGAPEATAASFRDGWFRTGDQGRIDDDGHIVLTGRLKEIINRGGEKVAPREVDDALLAHPDVKLAAAFGVAHPRLGEEVGAAVVLNEGATVTGPALRVFVGERLAPWKVPRRLVVVAQIPKGSTGKLDRASLAEQLGMTRASGVAGPPRVEPADDLERRLAEVWQEILGDDVPPGVESDFFELGGDSLHAQELLEVIETAFGRRLPATVFFDGATVRGMADRLRADHGDPAASFVVPVQPAGTRAPLFCVMRAGSVVTLRHLARTLGPDQPVYGVWMPSMHGPPDAAGSIEDIAATCVGLVREVQPSGPYSLFGHSLGAVVVYESARQLAATGEQVDYVGMADGVHPDMLRASWARRHSVRYRLRKLVSKKGPEVVAWRVRQLLGRNPPRPVLRLPGTEAILDWGATGARERSYHPGPAPAPLVVFATRPYVEYAGALDLGWAGLMPPGSEHIEVPGDHDSMIGEPHVHVLAAQVRDTLTRARGREISDASPGPPRPADGRTRGPGPGSATRPAHRP